MTTSFRGVAALAVALCLFSCSGQSTAPTTSGSSSPAAANPSATPVPCTLPVTRDTYDGFHIGVPPGWNLFTHDSTIVVSRDATDTEESTVTPVLVTSGLTPNAVFSSALTSLEKEVAAAGGSMTHTVTSSGDQPPAASLSLQVGQVSMAGQASVVVLPEQTAHGASVASLLASWAPTATFSTDREVLAAIGACYGPQPGTLYQVMKDQVFTYAIPVGWTVQSEGQDTIEIADGNDASANYVLTLLPPGSGVNSAPSLLTYVFGQLGIHIDQVVSSQQSPNQPVSSGGVQGQEYVEFIGTLKDGRAVHGMVNVVADTGNGTASGVIRLGMATTALWNSVNGALSHIINSIQHNFAQDLQQWEHLNQQQQAFNQQVQGFDYALNGVDLVNDPATGATFEAPYDAYNASGPAGPGYYDQAGNRLQVETP